MNISLVQPFIATDSYTMLPVGTESAPMRDLLYGHQIGVVYQPLALLDDDETTDAATDETTDETTDAVMDSDVNDADAAPAPEMTHLTTSQAPV